MLKIRDVYKKLFDGIYLATKDYFLFPSFFSMMKVSSIVDLSTRHSKQRSLRWAKPISLEQLCPVIALLFKRCRLAHFGKWRTRGG